MRAALAINHDRHEASESRQIIRHRGWIFNPKFTLKMKQTEWTLAALASTRRYLDYVYGVPSAFAHTTRAAYQPPGGINGYYAAVKYAFPLPKEMDKSWSFYFYSRIQSIKGTQIKESPLVEKDYSLFMGMTMTWLK